MRELMRGIAGAALLVPPVASGARRELVVPVGLVLGSGATISRDKQMAAVKPGEMVFAGDMVPGAVAAKGRAVFEEKELSGAVENRRPAAACLLPGVQRLHIVSRQNAGVVLPEAGPRRPATPTFDQRVQALSADVRTTLEAGLAAAAGDDAAAVVARAVALEKAGLLYDAALTYRAFAASFDEASWVKRKVAGIENRLRKERQK